MYFCLFDIWQARENFNVLEAQDLQVMAWIIKKIKAMLGFGEDETRM